MNALTALEVEETRIPALAGLRRRVASLTGQLRLEVDPADRNGWIDSDALGEPDAGPLGDLYARFVAAGFGSSRRATAASLLLRYGWASGFQIGAWLDSGVVLHVDRFALKFSQSTLVEAIWVQQARIERPLSEAAARAALLDSLIAFTEPLIANQHVWSRFSRHALWSMVVSSWAAQFAAIGERLHRRDEAVREGQRMFALNPEIARAAPDVYTVEGPRPRVCQRRSACCLYYKGPAKHFCASCPIIPEAERLERNRQYTLVAG